MGYSEVMVHDLADCYDGVGFVCDGDNMSVAFIEGFSASLMAKIVIDFLAGKGVK